MSKVKPQTPPVPVRITAWVASNPGWHEMPAIAEAVGAANSTTVKALKALAAAGEVMRSEESGSDYWAAPETPLDVDVADQQDAGTDHHDAEATASAEATSEEATTQPGTDTDTDTDTDTEDVPALVPVSPPDVEVIAVAGVLGDHADDGITVADLAAACGIGEAVAWRVILAADAAGAAVSDKPYALAADAKWQPTDVAIGSVRLADAPSRVMCPTCDRDAPVPGVGKKTAGGGSRRTRSDGMCADGQPPLASGQLRAMVHDYVVGHPGESFTPGEVQRAIGARPGGATENVLVKLSLTGLVKNITATSGRKMFQSLATPDSTS